MGIKLDESDSKVYRNTMNRNDRADEISSVDEGKVMVFALPSISTKKAKILQGLVSRNIIKEDRIHRT